MKSLKTKILSGLFALATAFGAVSCSDDNEAGNSTAPPVIDAVSASVDEEGNPTDLTPVTTGFADNVYIIQGSGFSTLQKVYFNDTDTYFNPTLVTDNTIFVTIDRDTPYANSSDEIRIVTEYGTATYAFVVAPPAPALLSYTPINASPGDVVTIYGSFFLNPTVTFGTTEATIISSTETMIQVTMPENANFEYVTVSTISGESTSTQATGTAIYDDSAAPFVENYLGPWDGTGFAVDTEVKIQGASAIRATFSGYTGFKFPMFAAPVSTANYSGIRVSLKSTKETGKFLVVVNGNFGAGKQVSFTSSWQSFVIPFSELGGNPGTMSELVLQEFGNTGGDVLYIDDVGFVLE